MKIRTLWLAPLLATALSLPAPAQTPEGRNEIVTTEPRLGSVTANAPIPTALHIRNEGGADGSGLCVITSNVIDGAHQYVADLAKLKKSRLWVAAKARPGGYYPAKLEKLLHEVYPDVKWLSWEGTATDLAEEYNRWGYPIGVTTNTGQLYGWQRIHHMVSLVHLDKTLACIVDNNDPGKYRWMTRAEFDKRFVDGEMGWMVVFLDYPGRSASFDGRSVAAAVLYAAAGLLLLAIPR